MGRLQGTTNNNQIMHARTPLLEASTAIRQAMKKLGKALGCSLVLGLTIVSHTLIAQTDESATEEGHLEVRPFPVLNNLNHYPASSIRKGRLQGYMIGSKPAAHPHPDYAKYYEAPAHFYEITADNIHTQVSEHFTLGQFLCKQASDYPKYIALQPSLLELLERLVEEFERLGYPVETFGVISGYRTPWYNRQIGNIPNSRHLYGDAMDFYLDADGNGRMDDINKDGRSDAADVDLLFGLVDTFRKQPENAGLIGGVGRYYPNDRHGGYIHVDTRGFRARW